jgi:nucleoid-associated protein YgaU
MRPCIIIGIAIALAGCSSNRPKVESEIADYHPPGTGPFDSSGNYVESWADKPSRWRGRSVPRPPSQMPSKPTEQPRQVASTPPPRTTPPPVASNSPPPPMPAAKPKPQPKPKPVKVKPKSLRITVKKGDTLYGIARRHSSSVAKIKKANGLKSDLIRPGQRLTIPR